MSDRYNYIFPRHIHFPRSDWRVLEQHLLEDTYIELRPVQHDELPYSTLTMIYETLLPDLNMPISSYSFTDLRQRMLAAGILSESTQPEQSKTEQMVAALRQHGIDLAPSDYLPRGADHASPLYNLGPASLGLLGSAALATMPLYERPILQLLEFQNRPTIPVGENLLEPRLPGSTRPIRNYAPYDSHIDLIGVAWENPNWQWSCPEDGKKYRILDLDWGHSLGIGFQMICLEGLTEDLMPGMTALVSVVAGVEMQWSHQFV